MYVLLVPCKCHVSREQGGDERPAVLGDAREVL